MRKLKEFRHIHNRGQGICMSYSLKKDRVFRQDTPLCFKYASKQNKYKSSLYQTL
jgi:hypothetical protein